MFLSFFKVSSCNLSEGQQWYLHQHLESPALQCKFTAIQAKYLLWRQNYTVCQSE